MDLAQLITDASVDAYRKECNESQCIVHIVMHGDRYEREVIVIPMAKHVLIRYKAIEYKINRQDVQGYNEIISFLLKEIEAEIQKCVNIDIEFDGYSPHMHNEYTHNYVIVERKNENVFGRIFKENQLIEVVGKYMQSLRFLN
jgi:hypothetical protein